MPQDARYDLSAPILGEEMAANAFDGDTWSEDLFNGKHWYCFNDDKIFRVRYWSRAGEWRSVVWTPPPVPEDVQKFLDEKPYRADMTVFPDYWVIEENVELGRNLLDELIAPQEELLPWPLTSADPDPAEETGPLLETRGLAEAEGWGATTADSPGPYDGALPF